MTNKIPENQCQGEVGYNIKTPNEANFCLYNRLNKEQ